MAGACSAGAYTAGVIDFLFEALTAWEAAKATGDPTVPDHDVMIRAAAGTSAGGIVAALVGMLPFTGHRADRGSGDGYHRRSAGERRRNLLYRSWVRDIDIRGLLAPSDIDKETGHVPSLLNGDAIVAVANAAIAGVRTALQQPLPPPPRFLANPLQLFLCFTNMQGVPYVIRMTSACGVRGHWVTSHAGCAHFAVFGAGDRPPEERPAGAIVVNSPDTVGFTDLDGWGWLRDAALASVCVPRRPAGPAVPPQESLSRRPVLVRAGKPADPRERHRHRPDALPRRRRQSRVLVCRRRTDQQRAARVRPRRHQSRARPEAVRRCQGGGPLDAAHRSVSGR